MTFISTRLAARFLAVTATCLIGSSLLRAASPAAQPAKSPAAEGPQWGADKAANGPAWLEDLGNRILKMHFPYFIPADAGLPALPIVAE